MNINVRKVKKGDFGIYSETDFGNEMVERPDRYAFVGCGSGHQ